MGCRGKCLWYDARLRLFHVDLYRVYTLEDVESLGLREILYGDGVVVIEWPERLGAEIPLRRWDVFLEVRGENERSITVAEPAQRGE